MSYTADQRRERASARQCARNTKRIEAKLCVTCGGTELKAETQRCTNCWQVNVVYQRRYRNLHKDKLKNQDDAKRKRNRVSIRANHKQWRDALKLEVISAYGGHCACCGEIELVFLTIDHINENGAAHRRELYGTRLYCGNRFYGWLKRHHYPKDNFQCLCLNCNTAKHVLGHCPHQDALSLLLLDTKAGTARTVPLEPLLIPAEMNLISVSTHLLQN